MNTGFYRVAASSPEIYLGDCVNNADNIIHIAESLAKKDVQLVVFPELCITGYSCADMFLRKELLAQAQQELDRIKTALQDLSILVCVGLPIEDEAGRLFNCAAYVHSGEIVGIVPKTYIPNYGEFYEKRWFTSADKRLSDEITLNYVANRPTVPFSPNIIIKDLRGAIVGTEICEDLWVSAPPSGELCKAGANIIINPSASNDVIGKREYRRSLVAMQSGRCRAGYVYASSGAGESSTDLVFSGHCIIADNGRIAGETSDYSKRMNKKVSEDDVMSSGFVISEIDIDRCMNDRHRYNSDSWADVPDVIKVILNGENRMKDYQIWPKKVNPYPFVPSDKNNRKNRCMEILSLQAKGLEQRLISTGIKNVVLGISGGLDSTLALLVCCDAFEALGIPKRNIYGITMPGFGTTSTTKTIADRLMEEFGVTAVEVNIEAACRQHMKDIGHPDDVFDVTYENIQARERTQVLFDYANMVDGLVIGTGDMSELALGWCTYNGDHMSNYAVNCSVPKTLVKYIVQAYASECASTDEMKNVLCEIADLPISPELLPPDKDGNIAQKTEESIGKYDLHDFFLYHFLRNGESRDRILKLAEIAFANVSKGEIEKTLETFFTRFRQQQFKRSCIPDGPKVGTVSLSPRGDMRIRPKFYLRNFPNVSCAKIRYDKPIKCLPISFNSFRIHILSSLLFSKR